MKKIFMIAMMVVATLTANAQNQAAGTFSLMPHVGLGYGSMTNAGDFDSYINAIGGAEAKYQISDVFGLSVGLDFQYTKSTSSESNAIWISDGYKTVKIGTDEKTEPTFAYLNIPVLAQFNLGRHFGAKVGVQPGFLVGTDNLGEYTKSDFKSTSFSIPVGFSYTFNTPIVLDLRYNIPVTRMNDFEMAKNVNLHIVSLTVGYRFDFGK